jgi:hypothetical protein
MFQGECEKCEDRGEFHGRDCIVRRLIFSFGQPVVERHSFRWCLEKALEVMEARQMIPRTGNASGHEHTKRIVIKKIS